MIFAIKDFESEYWLTGKAVFANDDGILPTLYVFQERDKL